LEFPGFPLVFEFPVFKFPVSIFEFRVLQLRISGPLFSSFHFEFRFPFSNFGFPISNLGFPFSIFQFRVSIFQFPVSNFEFLLSMPVDFTENAAAVGVRGQLFLVATPIGNLEDMTLRGIRTLKEADLIACEDTRRTQKLLDHYSIQTRVISYHEHNEMTRAPELVLQMEEGMRIALVSDAGMPVISDPGYRLVRLAIRHDIAVTPVPGPSAFVAALAVAGLPLEPFRFLGFLPSKRRQRLTKLRELDSPSDTLIFYEAPHRIAEMLEDVLKTLGDRPVVIGREVTKLHEEFLRGCISEILVRVNRRALKGELTVLIGPAEPAQKQQPRLSLPSIRREMEKLMTKQGMSEREALKALARSSHVSKSEIYRQWQAEKVKRR
jgi:16S rRNA (cytidine1402-2'-O)-methyltransferase